MAARNLKEAIHNGLCVGPLNEVESRLTGEIRDFLAHEVARHCKRTNSMENYDVLATFVQDVLKDISAIKGGK